MRPEGGVGILRPFSFRAAITIWLVPVAKAHRLISFVPPGRNPQIRKFLSAFALTAFTLRHPSPHNDDAAFLVLFTTILACLSFSLRKSASRRRR